MYDAFMSILCFLIGIDIATCQRHVQKLAKEVNTTKAYWISRLHFVAWIIVIVALSYALTEDQKLSFIMGYVPTWLVILL